MVIIVRKRTADFVAYFERWKTTTSIAGKTREEAIGKLILSAPVIFTVRDEAQESKREIIRKSGYARRGKP